jgi:hypothetical protein
VNGVAEGLTAPDISVALLCLRLERGELPSCNSSPLSFTMVRSPGDGIMDQMPKMRLRKKMNLHRRHVRTILSM